jgi:hypothetical protein
MSNGNPVSKTTAKSESPNSVRAVRGEVHFPSFPPLARIVRRAYDAHISTKLARALHVRRNRSRNGKWPTLLINSQGRNALGHARHEGAGVRGNEVDLPAVQDDHSLLVSHLTSEGDSL